MKINCEHNDLHAVDEEWALSFDRGNYGTFMGRRYICKKCKRFVEVATAYTLDASLTPPTKLKAK